MTHLTRYEALKLAAETLGTQQAFADLLEVSQPTIWRWLNQLKQLPAEHVLVVEAATGVSRHLLRPDIYPLETAQLSASAVGEEIPLCGPVLSARALAQHGNRAAVLEKGHAA